VAVTSTTGLKFLVSSVGPTVADADVKVTARADRSAGAYLMLVARFTDTNHFYAAQLNLSTNSFKIRRNGPIPNVWTDLGSPGPTPTPPFAADTDYTIRLQVEGTALRAKWWPAGQAEPSAWAVQVTDTYYASGQSGVAGVVAATSTTVNFSFDDFVAAPLGGVSGQSGAPSKPSGASSSITGPSDPMTGTSSTETTASAPTSTATPSPTSTATPSPTPTASDPATGGDDWRRRLADLLRLLRLGG
jgi:hypothetical protein